MRFTIRDLLWATALVAVTLGLGIGWLKDRSRLQGEYYKLVVSNHSELERVERQADEAWKEVVNRRIEEVVALERQIEEYKDELGRIEPGPHNRP